MSSISTGYSYGDETYRTFKLILSICVILKLITYNTGSKEFIDVIQQLTIIMF